MVFGFIVGKVLGQKISSVLIRWDMFKAYEAGGNGFSDAVVGQGIPAFAERRMRQSRTGHDALVITKEPCGTV